MTSLKDYLNDTLPSEAEQEIRDLLSEDSLDMNLNKELEEYFNSMTDNDPQLAEAAYLKAESALGLKGRRVGRSIFRWSMRVAAVAVLFLAGFWTYNICEDNFGQVNWIEKRVDHGEASGISHRPPPKRRRFRAYPYSLPSFPFPPS